MGIQNMFDDVLDANKRGHSVQQCRLAMFKLRQYGFKISVHLMPGLYGSTIEKDIETFRIAFDDPAFCPDEIKFYPTAVIPNTELFNLYQKGEYKPLTMEENKMIIKKVLKEYIPPYTRIKRLIRDIPAEETVGTEYVTNLRQLVENELFVEAKERTEANRSEYYSKLYPNLVEVADREDLYQKVSVITRTCLLTSRGRNQP
jgi:elongator complex protein 3